jgi:hypothetical protein
VTRLEVKELAEQRTKVESFEEFEVSSKPGKDI